MFNEFDNPELFWSGFDINPAQPTLVACGYDPTCYISTAKLVSSPYFTQLLVQAKLGGLNRLIEACDDSAPPIGDWSGDVVATFNNVCQNVTTEINGYLSSIYPIPLAQTGTVAVCKVTAVSSTGAVTAIEMVTNGNYFAAPNAANTPAYLRYLDPLANEHWFGSCWQTCQNGSGLTLTVTYADVPFSDENGSTVNAKAVTGTPVIAVAGTGYNVGDILVLTGGQSFVPAKIREAALILICHDLYQRRLSPDEKNIFRLQAGKWRGERDEDGMLTLIGHGEQELDGTYKRSFSIGSCWGTRSVLGGTSL